MIKVWETFIFKGFWTFLWYIDEYLYVRWLWELKKHNEKQFRQKIIKQVTLYTRCDIISVNLLRGELEMIRKITGIIVIVVMLCLTGCSNSNHILLTSEDYELSDNTTSKNISIGSSSEDFVKALI